MINIYARKTIAKKIDNSEADIFVDKNHSQGIVSQKSKKSVGLYYDKELIAVAQFGFPRTSAKKRNYSTELLRLCFKKEHSVIGGSSKIIAYYIKEYRPSDIFTYQDTTGKNSKVYEHAGFELVSQDKTKKYLVAPGKTLKTSLKENVQFMV